MKHTQSDGEKTSYRTCPTYRKRTTKAHYHDNWEDPHTTCKDCPLSRRPPQARRAEKAKKTINEIQLAQSQRAALGKTAYQLYDKVLARWEGGRSYLQGLITALPQNPQQKRYTVTYTDLEVEKDVPLANLLPAPSPPETPPHILQGIAHKTTDPRFPTDGDVILTTDELRTLLTQQQLIPDQKV